MYKRQGWDWGPQLPDMGIWRDIFIDSYEKAELSDLHIRQEHIDGKVFLSAETKVMLPEKAQDGEIAVSYTHLDVYKRQSLNLPA